MRTGAPAWVVLGAHGGYNTCLAQCACSDLERNSELVRQQTARIRDLEGTVDSLKGKNKALETTVTGLEEANDQLRVALAELETPLPPTHVPNSGSELSLLVTRGFYERTYFALAHDRAGRSVTTVCVIRSLHLHAESPPQRRGRVAIPVGADGGAESGTMNPGFDGSRSAI